MDYLPIRRAILSVTDKTGLVEFASYLAEHNVELVSTGGTQNLLAQAGLKVTPVSEVTGFPEILDGRVKTLHPAIHAGILARKDDPLHLQTLADLGIKPFDLVCVNLYDFSGALHAGFSLEQTVEAIDIGGPCLLRAAAKNFQHVLVLPEPELYEAAKRELEANDLAMTAGFRQAMAARTFELVSRYDALIASWLRPLE